MKEFSQKNTALQQQLESKASRVNDLERALSSSADEKDAQIRRLTTTVEELRESSRTRDVLCISLAEETNNLRQQLTDVGTQCQQMAQRLENSKTKQGSQLKVRIIDDKGHNSINFSLFKGYCVKLSELLCVGKLWNTIFRIKIFTTYHI